jgi:hypothetical protein
VTIYATQLIKGSPRLPDGSLVKVVKQYPECRSSVWVVLLKDYAEVKGPV